MYGVMILAWAVVGGMVDSNQPLVVVAAQMPDGELAVGQEHAITLSVEVKKGYGLRKAGLPAPIVQFDVPDSIELSGDVLVDHRALAGNEFLRAPYERLLSDDPTRVLFKLRSTPGAEDAIAFNLLAYVRGKSKSEARFVRQRYKLPVKRGAVATLEPSEEWNWGQSQTLEPGDRAAAFSLPSAAGPTVSLARHLGKRNVVVTTYRAFW